MQVTRRQQLILTTMLLVVASTVWLPRSDTRFVWNHTASVPIGLYRVSTHGAFVALRAEGPLSWVTTRGYVAPGGFLIKRVIGQADTPYCIFDDSFQTPTHTLPRLHNDARGRLMPRAANRCAITRPAHILVAGDHPRSVDSRYLADVPTQLVAYHLEPLWTF